MKTFNVWIYQDLVPMQVEAASRSEALKAARQHAEQNPVVIPGGHYGAELPGSEMRLWMPAKPAAVLPLNKQFARVKAKPSTFRRF